MQAFSVGHTTVPKLSESLTLETDFFGTVVHKNNKRARHGHQALCRSQL